MKNEVLMLRLFKIRSKLDQRGVWHSLLLNLGVLVIGEFLQQLLVVLSGSVLPIFLCLLLGGSLCFLCLLSFFLLFLGNQSFMLLLSFGKLLLFPFLGVIELGLERVLLFLLCNELAEDSMFSLVLLDSGCSGLLVEHSRCNE